MSPTFFWELVRLPSEKRGTKVFKINDRVVIKMKTSSADGPRPPFLAFPSKEIKTYSFR